MITYRLYAIKQSVDTGFGLLILSQRLSVYGNMYQRGVGCDLRVWLPHFYQRSSTCVQRCNQWLWCSCCNWSTDLLIPTAVPTGWQERAVWLFRQAP